MLVKDAGGFPIGSVPVTFAVVPATGGASGTFTGGATTVVMTNSSGIASTGFMANTVKGNYIVTATVTNLPIVSFALTNLADMPASISVTGGNSQVTAVTITFPAPLTVTVKDQFGNLVSGATVTFTAPTTGASATFGSGVIAVTNAQGVAQSGVLTANGTPGTYSVVASVPPGPQTSFTLTNVLGIVLPPNVVVAPGQSVPFNITLGTPAGSSGMFVTLTSSNTSNVAFSANSPTAPGSGFFPPGSQNPTAPPKLYGIGVGSAIITASAINFPPATQSVLSTYTITFSPATVQVTPPTTQLFMFLNGPAPANGLTVNISSSNTSVATVPATVTFQANTTQTNLPVDHRR